MRKEFRNGRGLKLCLVMSAISMTWQGTVDSRHMRVIPRMRASPLVEPLAARSYFVMPELASPAQLSDVSLQGACLRGGSTSAGNSRDEVDIGDAERAQQHPTMQESFLFGNDGAHQSTRHFENELESGGPHSHGMHDFASEQHPGLDDFERNVYANGRGESSRSTPASSASSTQGAEGPTDQDEENIEMFPKRFVHYSAIISLCAERASTNQRIVCGCLLLYLCIVQLTSTLPCCTAQTAR
eukprot:2552424-Rhodomonas_salina.1